MPKIPDTDLKLRDEDREELKRKLGPVVEGELPERYMEKRPIITVGDVVTDTLLEQGIGPDVCIVDGKTQRDDYEFRDWSEEEAIKIENPPSIITKEAWKIIKGAIERKKNVMIFVDGEEDMLSLVAVALCPLGGTVIYGIPGEGMVINVVSEDVKEKTWEIINKMIEVDDGR
ncbi:MAG: GTP-dependent dephospho-CoA kinase family protein [Candidatus Natronoplasma sp.]